MRAAFALSLLLTSCIATVDSAPPGLRNAIIRKAAPSAAWAVMEGERLAGFVVRFDPPDEPEHFLYSVRNVYQQDLGVIDARGRVYRYRPHEPEPEWFGSGSVLAGVRRVLGLGPETRIVEIGLGEAAAGPSVPGPPAQDE